MPLIIRRLLSFILFLFPLLSQSGAFATGLSAAISSTPSICSDDGTLTAISSGGVAPYTLTLLSGPADPNITYPVTLATGLTTFGGLPSGSYSVQVSDAAGSTATFTGAVPGTYQFPHLTFTINAALATIVASETGGHGPFQYAISSTGSNTGFGPYQASDTFGHICPGFYWIRVIDSCGNIYTNEITYTDSITSRINCINFSKGTLDVTAAGGNAPYTYSIEGVTSATGQFTGLPPYFSDTLIITDACGTRYTRFIPAPILFMSQHCPSDSIIYMGGVVYPMVPDTLTFICTNCIPAQTVTKVYNGLPLTDDTLFMHQPQSTHYNIVVLSSACGGDTIQHQPPGITSDITLDIHFLSCRSFIATVANHSVPVAVDSFVLSYVPYGPTILANTTGLFENLPDSLYTLTAYIGSLCGDTPRAYINIPYFPRGCYTLMMDASCHEGWEYSTNKTTQETYSLVFAPADTIASAPTPLYNVNFYGLSAATNYIMVSDSGCAQTLHTPPALPPPVAVAAYLPCVGQPVITFTGSAYTYCDLMPPAASIIRIKVFMHDSLIYDRYVSTDTSAVVDIPGTGSYTYAIYAINPLDTSAALRFDTICPIDTGSVFMDNTQVPYLLSNVALICDSTIGATDVTYQVYGGAAPYTVEIPGYDTVTLHTNVGIFPTKAVGTYTMIVYDNCGISRSVTFAIVDTCSGCPYTAIALPDTFSCAGDTVQLHSVSIHAQSYQWYVNGQPYSSAADTTLLSAAGGNQIMLVVTSATGCKDTAYAHTTDTCRGCPHPAISLADTLYCPGDTVHLRDGSIGGVSWRWYIDGQLYSTAADTTLLITAPGYHDITLYVTSATACTDSAHAHIHTLVRYIVTLEPDTVYCGPFSRVLSTGIDSTHWSTGQTGAQITVSTAATYTASAGNQCGTTAASVTLTEKPLPVITLGPDTLLCTGDVLVLDAGNPGDSYLWQNGSTIQTYTVTATGVYHVTVTGGGCSAADSVSVRYINAPGAFSIGKDTTICSIHPLLLEAYQPDAHYVWNTGSQSPFIYVTESGTYIVTDSNACGKASDSVHVIVESCSCFPLIPTAFSPNDDGVNDKYGAVSPCTPTYFLLEIYNRWGERMFISNVITDWWDGRYKNVVQPLAVYVYYMKFTDPYTGITYSQSGNVTLMR